MPNYTFANLNDLVFADDTQYDTVDPCDCDVCRPGRNYASTNEIPNENTHEWVPYWVNVDNIINENELHNARHEQMNTMEIAYGMTRANIRVLDERTAAHLYSRLWLLNTMGALPMENSSGDTRKLRMSDVFKRIGLVNLNVPEGATVPSWDRFVSNQVGPSRDTNLRAEFRRYMRDQGGH